MLEENFRRTLLLSRGDFGVFIERPITAAALAVCLIMLVGSFWGYVRRRQQVIANEVAASPDA